MALEFITITVNWLLPTGLQRPSAKSQTEMNVAFGWPFEMKVETKTEQRSKWNNRTPQNHRNTQGALGNVYSHPTFRMQILNLSVTTYATWHPYSVVVPSSYQNGYPMSHRL